MGLQRFDDVGDDVAVVCLGEAWNIADISGPVIATSE